MKEMRRKDRALQEDAGLELLTKAEFGVLTGILSSLIQYKEGLMSTRDTSPCLVLQPEQA